MTTDKKRETSRVNGAKSPGPITPEGKEASAQNALKHGAYSVKYAAEVPRTPADHREATLSLSSNGVTLPGEAEDTYDRLFNSCLERFQPADDIELEQVESIVAATWHTRRIAAAIRLHLQQSMQDNVPDKDLHFNDNTLYWHGLAAVVRESANPNLIQLHRQLGVWRRQLRTATRLLWELQDRRPKPQAPSQEKMRNEPTEQVRTMESTATNTAKPLVPETAAQIRARLGLPPRFVGRGSCPPPVNSAAKATQQPPENVLSAAA
jgi:hypothetical protein